MKLLPLALSLAGCSFAAITGVRVSGTTATQAVLTYTAPNTSACSLAVSETADANGNPQTPLIHDVDATLFPGANQDSRPGNTGSGPQRTFVIGKRAAAMGADGRSYSRALETNTTYAGKIVCGADTALFNFKTANIPLGIGYTDPWPSDPAAPGAWMTPSSPGGVVNEQFIEPQTGVRLQRVTYPGIGYTASPNVAFGTAYNQGQDPCDSHGPWSNPCHPIAGGGAAASVGNSTGWLVLRPSNQSFGWGETSSAFGFSLNQFQVALTGHGDSHDANLRTVDVCISMNAGAACASKIQTVTFNAKNGVATAGIYQPGAMGIDPWLFDSTPRINRQEASTHQGAVTVYAAAVNQKSGDSFSDYWTAGGQGRIRFSNVSVADACAAPPAANRSVEATIANGFGQLLNLTSAPGSFSFYCAPDFAVMIRRHAPDAASSIFIQSATFSYVSGHSGEWVDEGYNSLCSNAKVSNGYVCMIPSGGGAGAVVWIDPVSGTSNMIGPAKANGDPDGRDPWPDSPCPLLVPEAFQTFDDTKSVPTWYCIAPSGNTSVILQITYTGAYDSSRPFSDSDSIGAGKPSGHDNYSVTFPNAVITNLTPASRGKDLKSLLSAFEPSFDQTMSCFTGPVQQGNLLIYCYRVQNTLGWFAVFSPGDGNPAHAGQPGGPNIIGAMNSWSHGSARWSTNHSAQDFGYSGYFGYAANTIGAGSASPGGTAVMVTTHSAIPGPGSDCSQWGNPANVTGNNCTLLQIDANNGSYEPYYWKLVPPQGQAPGELSTAQVGDIWCLGTSLTSCNFVNASNEVLLLIQKGADGQWVFERNAGHWLVPFKDLPGTGPKYLFAMSGATNLNIYDPKYPKFYSIGWGGVVFWDYVHDPRALHPTIDPEYFDAHAVQRPRIAVESGQYPYAPWGGAYRVRHAENFPQLFAAPVSYVAANPRFAGAYPAAAINVFQSHCSVSGESASPSEGQAAFDVRPLVGKYTSPPRPPDLWTLVSGQLWKTTYPVKDPDDIGNLNRKLLPTAASSGSHPLIDVSGPASSLTDSSADSYQYCIPRAGGECRAGSVVGEVYVNAPSVTYPYCYGAGVSGQTSPANDICMDNMPAVGQGLVQFSTLQADLSGQFQRILVKPMSGKLKLTSGFANARPLPDNSWIFFQANYLDSARRELYMAKLPPWPAPDGVDRSAFVPLPLQLTAPAGLGVAYAIVEFGYREFNGNCTTRKEACIANAPVIGAVPFQFAGENPSGAPCPTTCAIAIPAVSQRILYYTVQYRDASNKVLATTPLQALATP
jgi:hypothetical protein